MGLSGPRAQLEALEERTAILLTTKRNNTPRQQRIFCVLHNTVEHNYISSSSTLGLQLHVSALYMGHLQVVT